MSNKLIHISSQGELSFEMALKRNVNKNKNNLKISFLLFQFDNSLTSHNSLKTITSKKNKKTNPLQSTRSSQKLPNLENNNKILSELYEETKDSDEENQELNNNKTERIHTNFSNTTSNVKIFLTKL